LRFQGSDGFAQAPAGNTGSSLCVKQVSRPVFLEPAESPAGRTS